MTFLLTYKNVTNNVCMPPSQEEMITSKEWTPAMMVAGLEGMNAGEKETMACHNATKAYLKKAKAKPEKMLWWCCGGNQSGRSECH
jgi:hypothetical protein